MKYENLMIPIVVLASGIFIFVKGFQNNFPLTETTTIFLLFISFLIGFSILCATIAISIKKIFEFFTN